jgi:hypothetical protein
MPQLRGIAVLFICLFGELILRLQFQLQVLQLLLLLFPLLALHDCFFYEVYMLYLAVLVRIF